MARTRQIKPSFFDNEGLGRCAPLARLLYQGLWMEADRNGRLEDRPERLKVRILPWDACDVNALLKELQASGFVRRYRARVGGRAVALLEVVNFELHQKPHPQEPAVWPGPAKRESGRKPGSAHGSDNGAHGGALEARAGDELAREAIGGGCGKVH